MKKEKVLSSDRLIELIEDNMESATVPIDAMGCQADRASQIVEQGTVDLPALKENQPSLYETAQEYFSWARIEPTEKKQLKEYRCGEHEYERHLRRSVEACNEVSWIETVRE